MAKLVEPKGRVPTPVYNKALRAVNRLRKKGGVAPLDRLPKGVVGAGCNCPIARALKPLDVTTVHADKVGFRTQLDTPVGKRWFEYELSTTTDSHSVMNAIGLFVEYFDAPDRAAK